MPFIRNTKGCKVPFSAVKMSSLLSLVYADALGSSAVPRHRANIQKLCMDVYAGLSDAFGDAEDAEWSGSAVRIELDRALRERAPVEVHEAFLSMKILELQDSSPPRSVSEPMDTSVEVTRIDPVWSIPAGPDTRRSEWLAAFRGLVPVTFPWPVWERTVLSIAPDRVTRSAEDWWRFWNGRIDEAMVLDPRVYDLKRVLLDQRNRARAAGQDWLDGTPLRPTSTLFYGRDVAGQARYASAAVKHLASVFQGDAQADEVDWNLIRRAIRPDRDALLSWRALHEMEAAGCFWPLDDGHARELPQWSWMRLCVGLSLKSPDREMRTADAIQLYDRVSTLLVIPTAAAVRDAGRHAPRFLEDAAVCVRDDFSSIQDTIHQSALRTKWTGTMASDWSRVRAKGAAVQDGRRISAGPIGFIKAINANLKAQGRSESDRPATVSLPIWHLDIEDFMPSRHESVDRVQVVVQVSDRFMRRVADRSSWTLMDPSVYPEVLDGANGHEKAEALIPSRKKQHPKAHREVSAERLWRRMIGQCRLGSPYLCFQDADRPFSPLPDAVSVTGLDGVGVFPVLPGSDTVEWPAIAVNIAALINNAGEPLLDEMRESLTWAFWMAERMYDWAEPGLSPSTRSIRPLCLGAVGFYEAVAKAAIGADHDPDTINTWVSRISESWSTLVTVVDQLFCQKHGPAPVWIDADIKGRRSTFHPVSGLSGLKRLRAGALGSTVPREVSPMFDSIREHRFSVRLLWAPFRQAAIWADVSPGGFGTLFPVEWVADESGEFKPIPTSYLTNEVARAPQDAAALGRILAEPGNPSVWPPRIRSHCMPDAQEWRSRLGHAALVRPWMDQGVSVTLPAGMPADQLALLVQQAWWIGVSNIRFEDPFRRPPVNPSAVDI